MKCFAQGRQFTRYLRTFGYRPHTIEVLQPGTHTTVQDFPGRVGYWDIGVPPSGPMDDLAFRLANRLVGNDEAPRGSSSRSAGRRCGSTRRRIDRARRVRACRRSSNGVRRRRTARRSKSLPAAMLKMRSIEGGGQRTYLAVRGGFDVPPYMGSRATFTLGQFGGHAGRALRAGDTLRMCGVGALLPASCTASGTACLDYRTHWDIAVMYGPHAAPDFFTDADIEAFFAAEWEVHYNSSRTGVRLIGPKPQWARSDGGEAGLHPSNIHDNAYAIGAIDFTGDMPVILGPDGPSLGGFVCPGDDRARGVVEGRAAAAGRSSPVSLRRHEEAAALERDR